MGGVSYDHATIAENFLNKVQDTGNYISECPVSHLKGVWSSSLDLQLVGH